MVLSKNDYKMLYTLYEYGGTTEMKSLTIQKLSGLTKLSESKIRISVREFKKLGYIREGAVQHNAKTYYITEDGINKVKELIKED